MEKKFKPGDMISCRNSSAKVIKWLGEGGQGNVYAVEYLGQLKALKWYKPNGMGENPRSFYKNLMDNIDAKWKPDKNVFLWPEEVTGWMDGCFGYVMPLRPAGYYEVGEYLLIHVRFKSLKTVIDAALNIVSAYRILHNNGYAYQDLNDGNFFIHPDTGHVLICDTDNVAPEGRHTGIIGKPGYIAPGIILKEKMPDSYSDRFSMSIIIFMLFCLTRPLEGRRTLGGTPRTEELMEQVYGSDPHFIMEDVNHPQYGPDRVAQKNVFRLWDALPTYMKDLFLNALGQKAIKNPGARPTEYDWLQALVRFRSEIIRCQCGDEILTENGESTVCSTCGRMLHIPYRLSFAGCNYKIPGWPDSRVYRCQLGPCDASEALTPIGRVLANQANPAQLGIRNLTPKYWNAETPGGKSRKVAPQEVVPLINGIKLLLESETITVEDN